MKSEDYARIPLDPAPSGLRTAPDPPQHRIESKRHLLTEEMLLYFGEICPALAERCERAIIELPHRDRREAAKCLQTLCSVSNETNRELATALAADNGHATIELLDRALASIEHLRQIAQTITQRIDKITKTRPEEP